MADGNKEKKSREDAFYQCMQQEQTSFKGFRFFAIAMGIGIPAMMFVPTKNPKLRQVPFLLAGLAGILTDHLFIQEECRKRTGYYKEGSRKSMPRKNIDIWGNEIKIDPPSFDQEELDLELKNLLPKTEIVKDQSVKKK
eukprot:jgi/Bigna1/79421/fgenesh1_pg.62_\